MLLQPLKSPPKDVRTGATNNEAARQAPDGRVAAKLCKKSQAGNCSNFADACVFFNLIIGWCFRVVGGQMGEKKIFDKKCGCGKDVPRVPRFELRS